MNRVLDNPMVQFARIKSGLRDMEVTESDLYNSLKVAEMKAISHRRMVDRERLHFNADRPSGDDRCHPAHFTRFVSGWDQISLYAFDSDAMVSLGMNATELMDYFSDDV